MEDKLQKFADSILEVLKENRELKRKNGEMSVELSNALFKLGSRERMLDYIGEKYMDLDYIDAEMALELIENNPEIVKENADVKEALKEQIKCGSPFKE